MTRDQIIDLCATIRADLPSLSKSSARGRKPALGLFKSVQATLTYLRRNHVQAELAELFDVSQATISRTIATLSPVITHVLGHLVPTADDLDPRAQLIVDGSRLPCWSWAEHPQLCSGTHRTTGLNVQVAATLSGYLAWVSDPEPGCTHDARALRESGLLDVPGRQTAPHIGDKGYIGLGMMTRSANHPEVNFMTATKNSTPRSTPSAPPSNASSPTSRPGGYSTPITDDPSPRSFPETITAVIALGSYRTAF